MQDAQRVFSKQEERLYSNFQTCLNNSEVFGNEKVPSVAFAVFKELNSKMLNLRKEDWISSWKRITLNKKGKTSSVTLMLRDELKPQSASKSRK